MLCIYSSTISGSYFSLMPRSFFRGLTGVERNNVSDALCPLAVGQISEVLTMRTTWPLAFRVTLPDYFAHLERPFSRRHLRLNIAPSLPQSQSGFPVLLIWQRELLLATRLSLLSEATRQEWPMPSPKVIYKLFILHW
jgi:hypothetical protein